MRKHNPESTQMPVDSPNHLKVILDNSIDAIITFNELGVIESINSGGLNFFGYLEKDILKQNLTKLIGLSDSDSPAEISDNDSQQKLLIGILRGKTEFLAKHQNGGVFPIQLVTNVVQLQNQKLITGFIRDVSGFRADLMQVKAMLGRREAWLAYLLSSHSLVIYSCNPLGNYAMTYISDNIETVTGYTTQNCYDDPNFWYNGIHPDDRDKLINEIELIAKSGKNFGFEYRFRAANGQYVWIHDNLLVNRDSAGNPIEMVGCWLDISKRKDAEQLIQKERERLKVTLESIGDAVITTNDKGAIDYLNPVAEELTGWTLDEAKGKPLTEVFVIIREDDRQPCVNPIDKCLQEVRAISLDNHTLLISRNGSEYSIQNSVAPISDPSGNVLVNPYRTLLLEHFHNEWVTDHHSQYAASQGCNTSCTRPHHFSNVHGLVEQL